MKDMLGKDIRVGYQAMYVRSFGSRIFEEALVIESEENFIKIQYAGRGSSKHKWTEMKKEGDKSKLTQTEKKIIILNDFSSLDNGQLNLLGMEREKFEKTEKALEKSLHESLEIGNNLREQCRLLQIEVDKIHSRFDILDIR